MLVLANSEDCDAKVEIGVSFCKLGRLYAKVEMGLVLANSDSSESEVSDAKLETGSRHKLVQIIFMKSKVTISQVSQLI